MMMLHQFFQYNIGKVLLRTYKIVSGEAPEYMLSDHAVSYY